MELTRGDVYKAMHYNYYFYSSLHITVVTRFLQEKNLSCKCTYFCNAATHPRSWRY